MVKVPKGTNSLALLLETVATERVTDRVYQVLRRNILDQTLSPGQKLTIESLARGLGVSRTPVHDALMLLENEGLVEIVPRKGTFVTELSPEDIEEVLDIRRALEWVACEAAVENVTEKHLARMERLMILMGTAPDGEGDALEHDTANIEFHQVIVELSGNRRMLNMYRSLNAHLKVARAHHRVASWKDRIAQERREHESILAALEARDPEALKKAVNDHLQRAKRDLLSDVRRVKIDDGGGSTRDRRTKAELTADS